MARMLHSRIFVEDENELWRQQSLEDLDLCLRLSSQLQMIGVHSVEQLRVLLAMRDKTRSQIVTTLRQARSKQIALTNITDPKMPIS